MNKYDVVIGIEIHAELNTKTKMFSAAPNMFGAPANTNVSRTDIAYPGTMPRPNKQAVIKAIMLAKALNMSIQSSLEFDRKHYFYPDLPKGFQITQERKPIGEMGDIPVLVNGEEINIEIERIQIEEDTAKSTHTDGGTLLDYNRAGVPLVEIITGPVMTGAEDAVAYVNGMKNLVSVLGISEAKMDEGSFRVDVNISLKLKGSSTLGTKVEIKNINTIKNIRRAISNEIEIQEITLNNNEDVLQATKRFDEDSQQNKVMRIKTDAVAYRFLPEPNINPIGISKQFISSVVIPELPWIKRERYLSDGIAEKDTQRLVENNLYSAFFDGVAFHDRVKWSKIFFSEIMALENSTKRPINKLGIEKYQLSLVMEKMADGSINGKQLKLIIPQLVDAGKGVEQIIKDSGMKQISDPEEISAIVDKVISDNAAFINSNKERKDRVIKYIIGNTMKVSRGQANPTIVNEVVSKKIKELNV